LVVAAFLGINQVRLICFLNEMTYNRGVMDYFLPLMIFALCFAGMAAGLLLARKALQKGCSIDPTDPKGCACRQKGIDPSECPEEKPSSDQSDPNHP
jgi:hypothetical protein